MVQYNCNRCDKVFKKKSHYTQHINKIKPCQKITQNNAKLLKITHQEKDVTKDTINTVTQNITHEEKGYKCDHCGKVMIRKWNMLRHLEDNCKIKKEKDKEKEIILQEILKELQSLKADNKELKEDNRELKIQISKINNKTNNKTIKHNSDNIINSNNNTQNFITINAYGKEDTSHITEKTWQSIMNKCFDSVPQLVGHVHYDDAKPENHNVYISNIKSNYAVTYNGHNWILQEKDKILDDIYTTKIELLEDKLVELDDKLDESAKRSLKRFLDRQEDNDIENMIKEKIKLRLYNNKKKPLKIRKMADDK